MLPLLLADTATTVHANKLRHSRRLPRTLRLLLALVLLCNLVAAWLMAHSCWRAKGLKSQADT